MKRFLIAVLGLVVFVALARTALAQGNPRGISKLDLKGKVVSVEYGRPSLKGRTVQQMFDQLKPGDFWRLGADKSTTFSTGLDLAFGDVTIPAGEYSLWASKESGGGWKLVFNKQHGQWGTRHDAAQDFAAAPLKETKAATAAETMTISLASEGAGGGVVSIHWGEMLLSARFAAK
jgi:hypothetical protein